MTLRIHYSNTTLVINGHRFHAAPYGDDPKALIRDLAERYQRGAITTDMIATTLRIGRHTAARLMQAACGRRAKGGWQVSHMVFYGERAKHGATNR